MRTDPTDNGGLFVGRRPGTRPIKYRALPQRGDDRRRRIDNAIAAAMLVLETLIGVSFWGPVPAGCLWVGSQVNYWTGSVGFGILSAFLLMLAALFGGLALMKRIDKRVHTLDLGIDVLAPLRITRLGFAPALVVGGRRERAMLT